MYTLVEYIKRNKEEVNKQNMIKNYNNLIKRRTKNKLTKSSQRKNR